MYRAGVIGLTALAVACGSRIERNPAGDPLASGGSSSGSSTNPDSSNGDDDAATGMVNKGRAGSYASAGAPNVGGSASVAGASAVGAGGEVTASSGGDAATSGGDAATAQGGAGNDGGAGGEPSGGVSIVVSAEPHLVVHEWYGEVTFSLVLSERPRRTVAVPLESSDIAHAKVAPALLVFTPDDWNVPQVATVKAVDDSTRDNNHPVLIRTLPAQSDDPRYDVFDADDVPVLVWDDTDVAVTIHGWNGGVTAESGTNATFSIVLGSKPTATVSFSLSSTDTTEGTVQPRVEIEPAEWAKPHEVTVFGVNDDLVDGNQPYQIIIGPAESTDPAYAGLSVPHVSVTNLDDDS